MRAKNKTPGPGAAAPEGGQRGMEQARAAVCRAEGKRLVLNALYYGKTAGLFPVL